jgi:hypothetical protein
MEHANKFELNRERRAGNNFWKRGLGREEHRQMEMAAKVKRMEKTQSNENPNPEKAEKPI